MARFTLFFWSFQLVDFSGMDSSNYLQNTFVASCNHEKGQFNFEIKEHKSEKYKDFAKTNIYSNVISNEKEDRIPSTKYITNGYNSKYVFSNRQNEFARLADGRNKMLQHYLFNNLGMAFTRQGMTIRQPGRFFGVSKESQNDKEYDDKLEGQYFILNVVHHFSTSNRNYNTSITSVKVHTYEEKTKFETDDLILIGSTGSTPQATNADPATNNTNTNIPQSTNTLTENTPATFESGESIVPDFSKLTPMTEDAVPTNQRSTSSPNNYLNPINTNSINPLLPNTIDSRIDPNTLLD